MTRKLIILIALYFGPGIFINSCLLKYDATICDVTFAALNSTYFADNEQPDRFNDEIGFEIWSVEKSPTCYLPKVEIFSSAFATSKCAEFQNELLESTYELSLDRPIVLNEDTIYPSTELLAIPEILGSTTIEINEDCQFVKSTIIFSQELIDRMIFEHGEYEVTFRCSTTDNKSFLKTRRVIFIE